jgi:hypothetical protein
MICFLIQNPRSKEFIRIGRYYCCYKGFHDSLKPREYLSSEVMNVWVEKFNHEARILAQRNPRFKKKFSFSQHFVVIFVLFCWCISKWIFTLTQLIHLVGFAYCCPCCIQHQWLHEGVEVHLFQVQGSNG